MGAVLKIQSRRRSKILSAAEHYEDSELASIEIADQRVYGGSDKQLMNVRKRYYGINKDNAAGWKFGTRKIGPRELLVFRLS